MHIESSEVSSPTLTGEVVDLSSARFADRLEPEYEQAWEELLVFSHETDETVENLMTPIWRDESVPQVFRDRALLLVVGTDTIQKALGLESRRANMAFVLGKQTLDMHEKLAKGFDPVLFSGWLREACKYQQENNTLLISARNYLRWHYEFLERGYINETELDEFINTVNIIDASPTWGGSGWDGDEYTLDKNRFPLLSDIFGYETVSRNSPKVLAWAADHLEEWLHYQTDTTVDIPEWLKAVPRQTGQNLFRGLINGGKKPAWLDWGTVRLVVDCFGLEIFYRHNSHLDTFDLLAVHNVTDQYFKEALLKEILRSQASKAAAGANYHPRTNVSYSNGSGDEAIRSIDIMKTVIQNTTDPELKELFALELRHAKEYEQRSRLDLEAAERRSQAEREASPEYQERQQKLTAFLGKVAKLPR